MEGRKSGYHYEVCRNAIRITDGMIASVNNIEKLCSDWIPIFNHNMVRQDEDYKRLQARLDSSDDMHLKRLSEVVTTKINKSTWLEGHRIGILNIIRSLPGSQRQHYHNGYPIRKEAGVIPASDMCMCV